MISTRDRILLGLGLVGAFAAAAVVSVAVPRVYDMLIANYVELSPSAHFLASYYLAVWLLPLLVWGLWVVLPDRKWRAFVASAPGLLALLLLVLAGALSPIAVTI